MSRASIEVEQVASSAPVDMHDADQSIGARGACGQARNTRKKPVGSGPVDANDPTQRRRKKSQNRPHTAVRLNLTMSGECQQVSSLNDEGTMSALLSCWFEQFLSLGSFRAFGLTLCRTEEGIHFLAERCAGVISLLGTFVIVIPEKT